MPVLEPLGIRLKYLSFRENRDYQEEKVRSIILRSINDISEENISIILSKLRDLSSSSDTKKDFKFDFVGISTLHLSDRDDLSVHIVIAVYPKWRRFDLEETDFSSHFFGKGFFSALHKFKHHETTTLRREDIGAEFSIFGIETAHLLECMLTFVSDVNRFGIYSEQRHVEHRRKGKANWKKTFQKGGVLISENKFYYLEPIRTKKSALFNEISQIHQETFSHSMTMLSFFFPTTTAKFPWFEKTTLTHVSRKINAVKNALRKAKIQTQRDRLSILLKLLEASGNRSKNTNEVIGITSKGFNVLWEQALLEVIGNVNRCNSVNNLVTKHFSLQIMNSDGNTHKWIPKNKNRHIIDGLAFTQENQIILFDAKNYKNWNGLGIGDVLKQYAYERLLTKIKETDSDQPSWDQEFNYSSFDYLRNEIIANVFVFPLNSIGTSEEETDVDVQMVGRYNIDYMREVVDNDLVCIEINPDMVLKQYSENSRALHSRFIEVVTDSAVNDSTNT